MMKHSTLSAFASLEQADGRTSGFDRPPGPSEEDKIHWCFDLEN